MSRYQECDDWDEDSVLAYGRWMVNTRRVFKSKNGQKALRQLRDALVALPDKRLISGALSTIGRTADVVDEYDELGHVIREQGEGVCAIGALLLHHHQAAGHTPEQAAALIPRVCGLEDGDGLAETAGAATATGMVYTLAWNVAYQNDERLHDCTPEERYTRMLAWVEKKLAHATST